MTTNATSDQDLTRRLTLGYMIGLLIIAALSISVHFILDGVISQQRDVGTVVNIAGRQRMLSQRIALFATPQTFDSATDRAELIRSIDLMERSESALTDGNDLGMSHSLSKQAHAYYFEGPKALDPQVRSYIALARSYVAAPDSPEGLAARTDLRSAARQQLLSALDGAVTLFEQEAKARVDTLRKAQKTVLIILLCAVGLEALFIFRPMVRLVSRYTRNLYEMATQDGLTGLANRRHFMESAERQFRISKRNGFPLAALILDLDHFKSINDEHGHQAGDDVLKYFADQIRTVLRSSDIFGRTGGEEFAAIIPAIGPSQARDISQRICQATASAQSPGRPAVTVSIGIAMLDPQDRSLDDLLKRADMALYRAKNEGRNRASF